MSICNSLLHTPVGRFRPTDEKSLSILQYVREVYRKKVEDPNLNII